MGVLTGEAEASWQQHAARVATAGTSVASKVSLNMSPSPAELSGTLRHAAAEGGAHVSSTSSLGEEPDKCVPPDPRGYLFPLLSNQFNNQLIGLAENIRLAQRLGRILVLTGFVEAILNASSTSTSLASDGLDFYHNSVRHRLRPAGMVAERPGPVASQDLCAWVGPSRLHSVANMALSARFALRPIGEIIQLQTILPLVDCVGLEQFKSLCLRSRPVEAHAFVPAWEPNIRDGTQTRLVKGRVTRKQRNKNNTTTITASPTLADSREVVSMPPRGMAYAVWRAGLSQLSRGSAA